jgi:hypothetical protein
MLGIRMKLSFVLLLISIFQSAQAQQLPSVETLLPKLYEFGQNYRATLPSLTCDESIVSQTVKNGKVQKEMKVESTLTEARDRPEPNPFTERHAFRTINGKPAKAPPKFHYLVQGGFANGLGFTGPDTQGCFDYHVDSQDAGKTLRLELDLKPGTGIPACKSIPEGAQKIVLVDAATYRITHVERTVSALASKEHNEVFFMALDYGPQKLGDKTFWLPAKMYGHDPEGQGRITITYSNFHRFAGELKVLPGDDPASQNP